MLWRRQIHFNLIMFPFPFSFNTELNYFLILPNQMQVQQPKYLGLVADLLPNIRLMQGFGHFLFRYITGPILIRKIYSSVHLVLLLFQFVCIIMNLAQNTDEVSELTCNYWTQLKKLLMLKSSSSTSQHNHGTILQSLHRKVHLCRSQCRQSLPHVGNMESVEHTSAFCGIRCSVKSITPLLGNLWWLLVVYVIRYHQIALAKMRKLLLLVTLTTFAAAVFWTTITFFGDSTKLAKDYETNGTGM